MQQRVFVTGIGIVSAIGMNADIVAHSLLNKKSGIGSLSLIDSVHKNELPVAEIKIPNNELAEMVRPLIKSRYSRTSLLGLIAARQAVTQSALDDETLTGAGLISATTVGGMDRTELFYRSFMQNHAKGKIGEVASHDCGDSTERIAECLNIKGFLSTINTACSSSANAILLGARMIKAGQLKTVVAGGTDALTLFTLNGFNSLMILDKRHCMPFDENRNGLNLGEGAAFLVLESEEEVSKNNKNILAEVTGYGNSCDAFHQTASSPEGQGAWLAMNKALQTAGLSPGDISYINAHGTGTKNNDLSEGVAIERIFGKKVPYLSSTKGYTGHTLGAAGAIEAVLSIMALQNKWVYPSLNFSDPMHELSFLPVTDFMRDVPLVHIMSNSFGFAGNNSSLIFSEY